MHGSRTSFTEVANVKDVALHKFASARQGRENSLMIDAAGAFSVTSRDGSLRAIDILPQTRCWYVTGSLLVSVPNAGCPNVKLFAGYTVVEQERFIAGLSACTTADELCKP